MNSSRASVDAFSSVAGHLDTFLVHVDHLNDILADITRETHNLKSYHKHVLLPVLPTNDRERYVAVIDRSSRRILDDLQRLGEGLKNLEKQAPSLVSTDNRIIAANQLRLIARKYKAAANDFRLAEEFYRQKSQQMLRRQLSVAFPDLTPEAMEDLAASKSGGASFHHGNVFKQALHGKNLQEARQALQDVTSRQEELLSIQRQVEQVAQMFQDIAMMVDDQDARLNDIFNAADHAAADLERGNDQVDKAIVTRKRSVRMYWCLLVVFLLALGGALLYLFLITNKGQMAWNSMTGGAAPAVSSAELTVSPPLPTVMVQ